MLADTMSVERPAITISWWEETKSFSTIYSNIKCRYYSSTWWLKNSVVAEQEQINTYSIITSPQNNNIQVGDKITIVWVDRSFIVQTTKQQTLFSWSLANHIHLLVKQE